MAEPVTVSYGALFRIPAFGRVIAATALGRLGAQMWELVLILFVLARYRSPVLAGVAVLCAMLPGIILSPIAGALLDRQGRVRLMILDYIVTAGLTASIAVLSISHHLPAALLLLIVTVLSISNILSSTGSRSLFPLMLPDTLWDRANGLDTSLYSLVTVLGPALAGVVVGQFGPETGLLLIGVTAALAAATLLGVGEPVERVAPNQSLARDALDGLRYVLRHRTLRGLAASLFLLNMGFGPVLVGIPVLVLRDLHAGPATVGQLFAVFGLAGLVSGLIVGRINTRERERALIQLALFVQVPVMIGLAFVRSLLAVFALLAIAGAAESAGNVGIFALRQRRTAPAWFGRAFAISMSLNLSGAPVGAAVSGPLVARSITLAMLVGAGISVLALLATFALIPAREQLAAAGAG